MTKSIKRKKTFKSKKNKNKIKGGSNPVGPESTNPFGPKSTNPFGPDSTNPFGTNPFGPNPFGPNTNPFGVQNTSTSGFETNEYESETELYKFLSELNICGNGASLILNKDDMTNLKTYINIITNNKDPTNELLKKIKNTLIQDNTNCKYVISLSK